MALGFLSSLTVELCFSVGRKSQSAAQIKRNSSVAKNSQSSNGNEKMERINYIGNVAEQIPQYLEEEDAARGETGILRTSETGNPPDILVESVWREESSRNPSEEKPESCENILSHETDAENDAETARLHLSST